MNADNFELPDMVKNHKLSYEGNWDTLYCSKCNRIFHIGADMCDSTLIVKELKRIDKIPCI